MKKDFVVVSYWWGSPLPLISMLHFESFFANNDVDAKYYLYLEDINKAQLQDSLKSNNNLKIINFKLNDLMDKYNIQKFNIPTSSSRLGKLLNKFLTSMYHRLLKIKTSKNFIKKLFPSFFFSHYSEIVPYSFSHIDKAANLSKDPAYRSDVFRNLIGLEYIESNVLYLDIDVVILKRLSNFLGEKAFMSQWGTSNYGNSAIFFLPSDSPQIKTHLKDLLSKTNNARPWIMFSDDKLRHLGIGILKISKTDPLWTPNNDIFSAEDFFKNSSSTADIIKWIDENCIFCHWHNSWNIVPDSESPYDILMQRYKNLNK